MRILLGKGISKAQNLNVNNLIELIINFPQATIIALF